MTGSVLAVPSVVQNEFSPRQNESASFGAWYGTVCNASGATEWRRAATFASQAFPPAAERQRRARILRRSLREPVDVPGPSLNALCFPPWPSLAFSSGQVSGLMGVNPVKFSRCSTIILMDSMESMMRDRNRVVDPAKMGRVTGKYVRLFSIMTSGWKRAIYLSSPDAAYWDIVDRERYDWARDKLRSLAQSVGIVVVDSTPMLRELRSYRDPENPRRATWARYVDYGPSGHW